MEAEIIGAASAHHLGSLEPNDSLCAFTPVGNSMVSIDETDTLIEMIEDFEKEISANGPDRGVRFMRG